MNIYKQLAFIHLYRNVFILTLYIVYYHYDYQSGFTQSLCKSQSNQLNYNRSEALLLVNYNIINERQPCALYSENIIFNF